MALLLRGGIPTTAEAHLTQAHRANPTSQEYARSLEAQLHSLVLKTMALLSLGVDCELAAIQAARAELSSVQGGL